MYYGEIKKCDIANGEGVRVSLFVSGCRHHCPGCFNQATWDFSYGKEFTRETEKQILEFLEPDYIDGLTLLGGEPFEPENQEVLTELLRKVKKLYPEKKVWCYSGYLFDKELLNPSRARCGYTDEMLSRIDVLVDGRTVCRGAERYTPCIQRFRKPEDHRCEAKSGNRGNPDVDAEDQAGNFAGNRKIGHSGAKSRRSRGGQE